MVCVTSEPPDAVEVDDVVGADAVEFAVEESVSEATIDCEEGNDGEQSTSPLVGLDNAKQLILQLRPARHALDLDTAVAARNTYPELAPMARAVELSLPGDLRAYEMSKVDGIPFSSLRYCGSSPEVNLRRRQETLITSFARMIAQSWLAHTSKKRRDSVLRPESPHNNENIFLSLCTGKVGSRIIQKLEKLSKELPDNWLRSKAGATLDSLRNIHDYPVVLNHGDLIPSNILVNEETWVITGLVDWAEAEWLPFGTCLYGLDHLLGSFQLPSLGFECAVFQHYHDAPQLRARFWSTLINLLPELSSRIEEVKVMRDVGVFLWHGYAWDEGAIDRVVDEVSDGEELAKLRAFMSI